MRSPYRHVIAGAVALGLAATLPAQQPQQPQSAAEPTLPVPAVGDAAPEFSFRPITSSGIAATPVKLSDYRGQTVVLWFFVRARTRG